MLLVHTRLCGPTPRGPWLLRLTWKILRDIGGMCHPSAALSGRRFSFQWWTCCGWIIKILNIIFPPIVIKKNSGKDLGHMSCRFLLWIQKMYKVDRSDHRQTIFIRTLYISQPVCNIISSQAELHRQVHVCMHPPQEDRTQGLGAIDYTSSRSCKMQEEHLNTLFHACINDHGESRSQHVGAINKRL